jgi:16S rRNA (uracil1498-N3)-methyltransferase
VPGALIVDGDDHAYLFRVRRLAVGDAVVVFDGAGRGRRRWCARSTAARRARVAGSVRWCARPPRHRGAGGAQGERMDWCLEKLVEVGADGIIVCETERGVVRLAASAGPSARPATRPSPAGGGRAGADVPPVRAAASLDAALGDARVAAAESAWPAIRRRHQPLLAAVPAAASSVVLIIGPEGGLAPDELSRAAAAGFVAVSLGATVLRAETAGAAAVFAIRAVRAAAGG